MNLPLMISPQLVTRSSYASRNGIDNTLPAELVANAELAARNFVRVVNKLEAGLMRPCGWYVDSWYRCHDLNEAVGGSNNSDHMKALAIDFVAPSFGTPYSVAHYLVPYMDDLNIGQLIYEWDWVHISFVPHTSNRTLTRNDAGYFAGILPHEQAEQ